LLILRDLDEVTEIQLLREAKASGSNTLVRGDASPSSKRAIAAAGARPRGVKSTAELSTFELDRRGQLDLLARVRATGTTCRRVGDQDAARRAAPPRARARNACSSARRCLLAADPGAKIAS